MHSIVLLTALTATSGLFGGGRQCTTGQCGQPMMTYGCSGGYCYQPQYYYYYPQPYAAPQAAPAPQAAAPAPQAAAAPAPQPTYYNAAYFYPTAPTCATGNCPYR